MNLSQLKMLLFANIIIVIILMTALSLVLNDKAFYVITAASVLAEISVLVSICFKAKSNN
ncbi:hypothetical protein E4V42_21190 [Clostridium estertheticum]|uniref:Uncharacterized protein n=1 Tax=Clostridium estertheticum TaxID=238834 RepID=A0A5N7J899_9CLOT|nr:hypothetical protein [Clostridium estertheticum]MPQ33918.1 hypothetical protein [Clostridium estertheticum]MPQ64933.1 hypothetical protein [Clostridium estertheticum]